MPRGRKPKVVLSTQEQIDKLQGEIEELEIEIKEKKSEAKSLERQLEEEQARELLDAIYSSGKSFDDVLEYLNLEDAE